VSWRGLHFSNPARLRLKSGCLAVERDGAEPVGIPLEDINYIVLESPQISLSAALLAACAAHACLVVICNEKHMPNGMLLPFHSYYQQQATITVQLSLTLPRKKRLWQNIVKIKIRNQASCLHLLGCAPECCRSVAVLESKVQNDDAGNTEALAARLYWSAYALNFRREPDAEDRLNSMLNYAYALVRAAISRDLAALGFIPALGIHHRGKLNPFNLSDDLIEPWRPLADAFVRRIHWQDGDKRDFDTSDRKLLSGLLHIPVSMPGGEVALYTGISNYVSSVKNWMSSGKGNIAFPDFATSGVRLPDLDA
jgi:CRISPR-associated protein Cas1